MARTFTEESRHVMGAAMRRWRKTYNVTQERGARFVGVARAQWARWERGEVYPAKYAAVVAEVISRDPHAGRPRKERFFQRRVRVQLDRQLKLALLEQIEVTRLKGVDNRVAS